MALTDVATLYRLFPNGNLKKPNVSFDCYPEFPELGSYGDYTDPFTVAKDRLTCDFLKKFKGFKTLEPEKKARETFQLAEDWCRETNKRLRRISNGANAPHVNTIMLMAQRKIAYVLGNFSVSELLSEAKWGPGVTSSVKGSFVDAVNKFRGKPEVSPNFAVKAAQLISLLPSWSALLADCDYGTWVSPVLHKIKGNSISFVPKTAKTDRTIGIEPHINSFFQLGLGRMIRKRLWKKAGVDLNDQTTNQRLAELGSRDDSLATIDETSASDCISHELVRQLLPDVWFAWLDMTRSHQGHFPNEENFPYEKFSSMGNGFTFDLESLIFWAVSQSVVESLGYNPFWVNIMGDDIIVPSRCYLRVTRILAVLGFVTNKQKSFYRGPFRESCGKDYWRGSLVRPIFLKEIPDTPLHWLQIANSIRRLASHWLKAYGSNIELKAAYDFAVSRVPPSFRNWIPDGYGDGGLISNLDEATPPVARDHPMFSGWEGFLYQHLVSRALKREFTSRSLITSGVHTLSEKGNRIALRDQVDYKKVTSVASEWRDLGGWE